MMIKASKRLQTIWSCNCVRPSSKKSATHAFASIRRAHAPRVLVCAPSPRRTFQDFIEIKNTRKLAFSRLTEDTNQGNRSGPKPHGNPATTFLRQCSFQVCDGENFRSRQVAAATAPLRQHCLVKLVPIVKIVQVHRVFWRRSVIRNVACAENLRARFVVMIVAAHRCVVFLDRVPI